MITIVYIHCANFIIKLYVRIGFKYWIAILIIQNHWVELLIRDSAYIPGKIWSQFKESLCEFVLINDIVEWKNFTATIHTYPSMCSIHDMSILFSGNRYTTYMGRITTTFTSENNRMTQYSCWAYNAIFNHGGPVLAIWFIIMITR